MPADVGAASSIQRASSSSACLLTQQMSDSLATQAENWLSGESPQGPSPFLFIYDLAEDWLDKQGRPGQWIALTDRMRAAEPGYGKGLEHTPAQLFRTLDTVQRKHASLDSEETMPQKMRGQVKYGLLDSQPALSTQSPGDFVLASIHRLHGIVITISPIRLLTLHI